MKTFLLLSVLIAAASSDDPSQEPKRESKQIRAEVVSTDKTAKTLTIKTESHESMTGMKTLVVKVEEKALSALETVKPGEKVTLTCRATRERECDTVAAIQKAASANEYD